MSNLEMRYFILKPKSKTPQDLHAQASRKAIRAYAKHIYEEDPEFAEELFAWAEQEHDREQALKGEITCNH